MLRAARWQHAQHAPPPSALPPWSVCVIYTRAEGEHADGQTRECEHECGKKSQQVRCCARCARLERSHAGSARTEDARTAAELERRTPRATAHEMRPRWKLRNERMRGPWASPSRRAPYAAAISRRSDSAEGCRPPKVSWISVCVPMHHPHDTAPALPALSTAPPSVALPHDVALRRGRAHRRGVHTYPL